MKGGLKPNSLLEEEEEPFAFGDSDKAPSTRFSASKGFDFNQYVSNEMEMLKIKSGITLSFNKVSYTVRQQIQQGDPGFLNNIKNSFKKKQTVPLKLLNNVSGFVEPGMLVLLLGPPGAGKTTLLEVLAGRKTTKRGTMDLKGEILVNGQPWTEDFNRIAGFVTQEDFHIPQMTVRETFMFSSQLRNHPLVSLEKKKERVEVVLDILGLRHTADTVVGGELLRGVSGGERKRVSIGVELVKGPGILLLDEPTTGLDSSAAMDVVRSLRTLADAGIPVICSLLQPSQELYDMFDHVMLMNQRQVTFFGKSSEVLNHFADGGFHCPAEKNPAEFLLDICTPKARQYMQEGAQLDLNGYYKRSPAFETVRKKLWEGVAPPQPQSSILPSKQYFATGTGFQTLKCSQRAAQSLLRNRRTLIVRLLRSVIIGLILGTLFFQMKYDTAGAQNRISLLFFCITFNAMGSVASIPQVVEERRIFYHQRAAHFFRTIAYFLSTLVMDIPQTFMESFVFTTIVFWMTGMNTSGESAGYQTGQYLTFFFILFLTSLSAKQWCRVSAACTPNLSFASSLAPAVLCIWLLFAGFLIPRQTIPVYWRPVNWISTFRYTFESLAINELQHFQTPVAGVNGTAILDSFGLYQSVEWLYGDIVILFGFYIFFCVMTFLCLKFLNFMTQTAPPMFQEDLNRLVNSNPITGFVSKPGSENDRLVPDADFGPASNAGAINSAGGNYQLEQRQGKTLAFYDLSYSVTMGRNLIQKARRVPVVEKQLLFNIAGYAEPYKMVALMGASGAGKTTLLDVLAQRKTGGVVKGHILIDGYPKDQYYNRLVGYVEQSNVFLPTLTVVETILFNANMRLPTSIPFAEKKQRALEVMRSVGLSHVALRPVGAVETGGLSPELRKKLSIACELVADPAILYLDEPTSGLDSQAAENVMIAARAVCDSGVPVICTIHQPSADLFLMFDWLLCLKPGGQTIYFGPLGDNGSTVLQYFSRYGQHCEPGKNPADFVLKCSGAGIQSADSEFDPATTWKESPEARELDSHLSRIVDESIRRPKSSISATGFTNIYAVPLGAQIKMSIRRAFANKFRQPQVNRVYMLTYGIMGVILGLLYLQLPVSNLVDARNRVALLYFILVFSALGAIAAVPGLILQRAVYYREKPAFLRPVAYFIATVLSELPVVIISSIGLGTVLFFMVFFNFSSVFSDSEPFLHPNWWQELIRYVTFLFVYVTSATTCVAFAMAIASSVATAEVANTLVGVGSTIFSLFAGFIIPKDSIPVWWKWLHYIDFYKYPLEALSINEFIGTQYCNTTDATSSDDSCPQGYINGTVWLNNNYNMATTWEYYAIDAAATFGFLFLFIFLCFVGIRFINHLKR